VNLFRIDIDEEDFLYFFITLKYFLYVREFDILIYNYYLEYF